MNCLVVLYSIVSSFAVTAAESAVFASDNAENDSITASEIESLFFQNLYTASTLRVTWAKHGGPTEDSALTQKYLLEMAKSDSSVQQEYIQGLENSIATPPEKRCTAFSQDFFTDRQNFQVRFQLDDRGSSSRVGNDPPGGKFPDSTPTQETLPTDFGKISITSFGPATNEQFRRWDGQQPRPGYHSAIVSTENIEYTNELPPLAMPSKSWGVRPSWIDQAFVPESLSSRVVGVIIVDGTETTVLERVLTIPESTRIRTYLAYCDLQRGSIPVRIEVYESGPMTEGTASSATPVLPPVQWKRLLWDGVLAPDEVAFPQYVIRDIQIEEFSHTWYPVSGTVDQYCPSGRDRSSPLVICNSWRWKCSTVEINPELNKNLFSLEFPIGTVFVDHTRGETRLVGDSEGYSVAIMGGIKPQSASDSRYQWIKSAGWIMVVAGFVYAITNYWRRRFTK